MIVSYDSVIVFKMIWKFFVIFGFIENTIYNVPSSFNISFIFIKKMCIIRFFRYSYTPSQNGRVG